MKFNEIINQEKPVLVDFFATWCGPCKMQAPMLKELKDKMKEGVSIIKIDVDKNQSLAARYGIRSVPTLMLFNNGVEKWRQSGVFPADKLEEIILSNT